MLPPRAKPTSCWKGGDASPHINLPRVVRVPTSAPGGTGGTDLERQEPADTCWGGCLGLLASSPDAPGSRRCPAESRAGQGACGKGRSSPRALGGVRPGPQVTRTASPPAAPKPGVTWCRARCWAAADWSEKGGTRGWSRPADFAAGRSGHLKVQTPAASIPHPASPSTSAFFVPLRELTAAPEGETTEVGASSGALETEGTGSGEMQNRIELVALGERC